MPSKQFAIQRCSIFTSSYSLPTIKLVDVACSLKFFCPNPVACAPHITWPICINAPSLRAEIELEHVVAVREVARSRRALRHAFSHIRRRVRVLSRVCLLTTTSVVLTSPHVPFPCEQARSSPFALFLWHSNRRALVSTFLAPLLT